MKKYLFDTNSIIYAINGVKTLKKEDYFISIITEIELLSFSKLSKDEELILKKVLENFKIISLNEDVKNECIKIRKTTNLKLPDSIILASTKVQNAILVTSDKQLLNSKLVKAISLGDII